MKKRNKIFLWVAAGLGSLLCLLAVFLLLLPKFINIEPVRERIMANLSRSVGGQVTYQKVDISFLPLPRMAIHGVELTIPGKTGGTIDTAIVYPRIISLLRGRVELRGLELESPRFRIDLTDRSESEGRKKEKASYLPAPFSLDFPVKDLVLEQGRLEILRSGHRLFLFQHIEAELESQDEGIRVDLTCASNVVGQFSVQGRFDPETFKGRGQFDLAGIKPHLLTQAFLQDKDFRLGQSHANLKLNVFLNGPRAMNGKFQGSMPSLVLNRGERQLTLQAGSFTGAFQRAGEKTMVSLNNLSLEQPQVALAASLGLSKTSPLFAIKVQGNGVDVTSVRKAALEFLGDDETVLEIFDIVRGGHLPSMAFETRGDSADALGDLGNMVIRGNIEQGMIRVPGVGMDLTEVTGDALISKGILNGENLKARDGKTLGKAGRLEVGLEGEDAPFHLDIHLDADLATLPPFMKKVVEDEAFKNELDLIKGLTGKASGRLVLGDRLHAMTPRVEVSQFNLSAKYQRLPFAVRVSGGRLVYQQAGIRLENVKAEMGKSSVFGISGRVNLGKTPSLDINFRDTRIHAGEVFPWIKDQAWWPVKPRDLKRVTGLLNASEARFNGPFLRPEEWQIAIKGSVQDLVLASDLIPMPVRILKGSVQVDQRLRKNKISVKGVQIDLMDASFQVTGTLWGYLKGLSRADLDIQGTVDEEVAKYLFTTFKVPPHLHFKTPITFSGFHFAWERGKQASYQGTGNIQNGPHLSLDVLHRPGEIMARSVRIHDEVSQAEMSMDLKEDVFKVAFKGHLKQNTLRNLFVEQLFQWGEIRGDIQAQVFLKQPMKSTARGFLEGDDLIAQMGLKEPLRVDRISLKAQDRHIEVQSAGLVYQDHHLMLKGGVDFSRAGLKIDMDARAGHLDWADLAPLIQGEPGEENGAGKKTSGQTKEEQADEAETRKKESRRLKVEGVVRFQADSFKYTQFLWKHLHADISLDSGGVRIDVKKADLCGISTPGTLSVKDGEISLNFRPKAEKLSIEPATRCLRGEQFHITGTINLEGEIRGKGSPEQLVRSLEGYIHYDAANGRIYRDIVLINVLRFLNITEILRGRFPDIGEEGFAYLSITCRSRIQDGKLLVEEGRMDGKSADIAFEGTLDLVRQKIDGTVLVSPAKTANWIIRHTPLVGRIMGGSLITVPVRITGPLDHVEVTPIPTTMVGGGLLNMMKRTVELPFTLIHANPSEEKK